MENCIVIASAASRKSVAIAKSVKKILGLRVVGVFHKFHPYLFSRWFDYKYAVDVDREHDKWPIIVAKITEKCGCNVVVPVDYVDFEVFTRFRNVFEEKKIIVAASRWEDIVLASNRIAIVERLRDIAQFPSQIYVENSKDIENVYELVPPLVVKKLGDASNPSFHLDFETAIDEALRRKPCLVQEYVEGVARGYYAVSFDGDPLLEFTHERIVEYDPIGGASLLAKGFIKDPTLYLLGRKIVKALKWSGPIMVETRYVDEYGQYYVIEINPKFWGSIDLSISLDYHFPAILVAAYLYGFEYAKKLVKNFKIRDGGFAWIVDGFRYNAKIPKVWLKIAQSCLYGYRSDVEFTDFSRNIAQIVVAFKKLEKEKKNWQNYLNNSRKELTAWINRFLEILKNGSSCLILDLDGTIVEIPLNWGEVRKQLKLKGLLMPWESINRALVRLWYNDRTKFYELSKIVEEYEREVIDKVRKLIDREQLQYLKQYFRICIATKQSYSIAVEILKKHKFYDLVNMVIGRDSGFNPVKIHMYRICRETLNTEKSIVVDDNIAYIVEAYRKGFVPFCASKNPYIVARSYRLGIPSGLVRDFLKLVSKYVNVFNQSIPKNNLLST